MARTGADAATRVITLRGSVSQLLSVTSLFESVCEHRASAVFGTVIVVAEGPQSPMGYNLE